jgi:diguanylate cyclase (GGDEF)-like protein/PAS domain S-box-containing protein
MSAPPATPWQRLHTALMPDYNRPAAAWWWFVVLAGAGVLGHAVLTLAAQPHEVWLQVLVGAGIAMLAGVFPVRIPGVKTSFAAGELFIFLMLLLHGPAAAVLAAAGEGFVGSMRTSRRWTSRLATPAMAALAMAAVGHALQAVLALVPGSAPLLIVATMVAALAYFVVNAQLVTAVGRLKRGEGMFTLAVFDNFGWVSIAFAGSAALASLLYLVYLQSGLGVLMAMVPILAMLLATLHYFFRQQEAAEAARAASAEAVERERELAERHVRELEASERRFQSAFTHAGIGMALLAFDGRILQANVALESLVGRDTQALAGMPIHDLVHEDDRRLVDERLGLAGPQDFDGFSMELRCRHREGRVVWVSAHCSFFSEPDAGAPCLILQLQDITARRRAEEDLHHLAFHDSLTGLPNRRRFHELLAQVMAQHAATAAEGGSTADGAGYAVMFLDFDRFKLINDSLGHDAGDAFLVQVARRIVEHLRPHDVVARLGGDEFGVLVRQVDEERTVVALAERLMEALKRPFVVAGTELTTSASIGITFSALGYTTPEAVLRDADTAMYKAKGAGKARYALFDASLHTEVAQRLRLEGQLRRAIDEERLAVAYQPVYELGRQPGRAAAAPGAEPDDEGSEGRAPRLVGFEALVRWSHPEDGTIGPGQFLPIAEEAGLMVRITDFVLHCACRQLAAWQALGPAWAELSMHVNVSSMDLAHPALSARVSRALIEAGVAPKHLVVELTEDILASRLEAARPQLAELQRLGVGLAIDDFGTGYSSLSHLSTLPLDCLKIDRSFVQRLEPGSNEAAVVRSIMLLGRSLGKRVVAEGIETASQLAQLRELGCRYGQGFLLGRPMKPAAVSALLAEGNLRAGQPVAASPLREASAPLPWASPTLH